jgi:hypothetical protein
MLIKRLARFLRQHDWSAVALEILVVIVGLMLAFQLDRWWEQRGEQAREAEYVARLIADVEADIPAIGYAIELAGLRKEMADLLMEVAESPATATMHPVRFIVAVQQAAFTYSPSLTTHTFEDMRSTGNLGLLRNPTIKGALYSYYNFDRSQNQYRPLQFMSESRHFELAAGVLSYKQARLIQDTWYVVAPGDLERFDASQLNIPEVQAAAERFRSKADLLAWLPELRHLQIEQIVVNESRLEKAKSLLRIMNEYATSLSSASR